MIKAWYKISIILTMVNKVINVNLKQTLNFRKLHRIEYLRETLLLLIDFCKFSAL